MKKSTFRISRVFLILAFCFISFNGYSQGQKLSKKDSKEVRKAKRVKDYEALGTLLESRKFSFQTERAQANTGATVYNIVQIDEARVFVRCEDPINTSGGFSGVRDNTTPRIGPTGLFFEGDIDSWELSNNLKQLSYIIKFHVITTGSKAGSEYYFAFNINPNKSAGIEIKSRGGQMIYSNYSGLIRTL